MKSSSRKPPPGLGEEVLFCCKKTSARVHVEKALIEQLIEGRDGMIRKVVIRSTEGNNITRPIQLVIPLEFKQGGEDVEKCLSP